MFDLRQEFRIAFKIRIFWRTNLTFQTEIRFGIYQLLVIAKRAACD